MAGPRQIVNPPAFTPTPYGLLTTVEFPTANGPHWENGITYQPNCASPSSTYDECIAVTGVGAPPPPPAFQNTVSIAPRGATAFTVMVEFDCAAVGNDEARQTALTAMASTETWQVERSFWTGVVGGLVTVFPHLAANATVLDAQNILLQDAAIVVTGVSGDLLNMVEALGLLEGALADCYNGVGIIHVPQHALASLDAWGLLHPRGPVMYTAAGNKIAVGAGYPGTSPAGAVRGSNTTWLYATGSIMAYKGEMLIRANDTQSFDKQKNTRKMIAERRYVLGWDCCHFAVNAGIGTPKGT